MQTPNLGQAIPVLPSGNLDKTAKFFADSLGFEIVAKFVEHKYLIVRRGSAEIHFWQATTEDEARALGRESGCYIRVENIEALFKELKDKQAPIRNELTKQSWGMIEMQVDDPYENAIRFGSPAQN